MKIITDSAADLTPDEIKSWGIPVMPLMIQFPGEEIAANAITPDEFYNRLRAMEPQIPTTAQPSVGMFDDLYRKSAPSSEEILAVHISSGLSGTYGTATLAAQGFGGRVTTVDTLTLSVGQRFQVLAAANAARRGWSKEQIIERLSRIRAATETVFTLETLDYLARGGRIGRVQAIAGSLLRIKPVISVEKVDGKYGSLARGRTVQQNMATMADHYVSVFGNKPVWVSVAHGQWQEKADSFASLLKTKLNIVRLEIIRISPVLGVHTGPGIVGAGVMDAELVKDLIDL